MSGLTFNQWMILVDQTLLVRAGVGYRDLADIPYRDYYTEGVSPSRVAAIALANDGFDVSKNKR